MRERIAPVGTKDLGRQSAALVCSARLVWRVARLGWRQLQDYRSPTRSFILLGLHPYFSLELISLEVYKGRPLDPGVLPQGRSWCGYCTRLGSLPRRRHLTGLLLPSCAYPFEVR